MFEGIRKLFSPKPKKEVEIKQKPKKKLEVKRVDRRTKRVRRTKQKFKRIEKKKKPVVKKENVVSSVRKLRWTQDRKPRQKPKTKPRKTGHETKKLKERLKKVEEIPSSSSISDERRIFVEDMRRR